MNSYSTSWWSLLLIYRPREDERLSWPCWLTYSGWFIHINGYPSAAGQVQASESSLVRDRRSTTEPPNQYYHINDCDFFDLLYHELKYADAMVVATPTCAKLIRFCTRSLVVQNSSRRVLCYRPFIYDSARSNRYKSLALLYRIFEKYTDKHNCDAREGVFFCMEKYIMFQIFFGTWCISSCHTPLHAILV